MAEEIYGRCAKCGGPLLAGHECAGTIEDQTASIAKLVVDTARGGNEKWTPEAVATAFREVARTAGYAIGEHGSKARDVDLIAVPWVAEPLHPLWLLSLLVSQLDPSPCITEIRPKPHGRIGVIFQGMGKRPIDLSIMPPQSSPPASTGEAG
jgi:hypothetical protein